MTRTFYLFLKLGRTPESTEIPKSEETLIPPKSSETSNPPLTLPTTPKSKVTFDRFASIQAENAYKITFSHHPVLGEREININDYPAPEYALIKKKIIDRH